jgi:pilus assembly protein CpaF
MTITPLAQLTVRVRRRLAETGADPTRARIASEIQSQSAAGVLGNTTLSRLAGRVSDDLVGAGPLAELLADDRVSDVLVNGVEAWVDHGDGLCRVELSLGSLDEVRRLAQRLVAAGGRRLDDGCPYADIRLPDGTRLHAVLPPVAMGGPYLSLRRFRQRAFSIDELVDAGTVNVEAADLLAAMVAARVSYLITGGAGSGKTTLLSTLLSLVPASERLVLVEDAAELRPVHPHVVRLQARTSNVEGSGEVSLRDLVRQALRMRPDRLVVGECRGPEVVDLLGALNTGHDGGAATLHANAPADVPARLEALGLLGGVPRAALHAQLASAVQAVVQVRRVGGRRVVDEICLLVPVGEQRWVRAVRAWSRLGGQAPAAEALDVLLARGSVPDPARVP